MGSIDALTCWWLSTKCESGSETPKFPTWVLSLRACHGGSRLEAPTREPTREKEKEKERGRLRNCEPGFSIQTPG